MSNERRYDIIVVGGGIIGCAVAKTVSERHPVSVALIEAEDRLAAHQTGNNSGVIHSGLYYRPGSDKARYCTAGREALYRFSASRGIPHERCGKLVVATTSAELEALDTLSRRGLENGLVGIRPVGPAEIREREPLVAGIAGLLVPQTGIIDYHAVTRAYAEILVQNGGALHLSTRLLSARRTGEGVVAETTRGAFHARGLIACAGLQSDRVARRCGMDPGLRIVPFRGEYYELIPGRRHLVNHLVYPVPDPRFPFLGVHFTRMVNGEVEAGPNAVLAFRREGYRWRDISLADIGSYLFYIGFWRMALRYWRVGLLEIFRSLSKRAFVRALRPLMPSLARADLRRASAGVRAQALTPDGRLSDDFEIAVDDRMIHVLNAPSPAATASLAIGEQIADMAEERFGLERQ